MDEFLNACRAAALIGGEQLESYRDRFQTSEKGRHDLVTDSDLASQRAIHDYLYQRFPDHGFLGEESIRLPMVDNSASEYRWIVDPLDGTLNYVHQLQSWSVSIALQQNDQVVAGAVYDPWLQEMYLATCDGPATLNGVSLQTRKCDDLQQALLVVSLPTNLSRQSPEIDDLIELMCSTRSVRRLGSAALNLCYLAAGRVDAYWATRLNLWDVAAGWLILEQAGGWLCNPQGGPVDPNQPQLVAAANETLASKLVSLLNNPAD